MSDDGVKPDNIRTWIEFLSAFDQARGHFAEAYRHSLLGTAEVLRVFEQIGRQQLGADGPGAGAVGLIELVRKGLLLWADRIPALLEASSLDLAKREALLTVKEVIMAEMQRLSDRAAQTEPDRVKFEALEAILRVIDLELERRASASAEPGQTLRRVVIE